MHELENMDLQNSYFVFATYFFKLYRLSDDIHRHPLVTNYVNN